MTIASDLLQRHIETLVADNGQWQTLSSGTSPETAAIAIGVDAAPGVAFGDQPVVADLDNFKVSGRSARC